MLPNVWRRKHQPSIRDSRQDELKTYIERHKRNRRKNECFDPCALGFCLFFRRASFYCLEYLFKIKEVTFAWVLEHMTSQFCLICLGRIACLE